MFDKILIANRGEIAVRIMATCREMGIKTVAVYSGVDREALHVLEADEAVLLGPAEPSESYLNVDRIIEAAQATGARAIHPGYGFLAENASFAERCEKERIVFIGPPAKAIRDLGDKTVARRTMQGSGVPVIPGMMNPEGDTTKLAKEAERIGYPVLIKAAGGEAARACGWSATRRNSRMRACRPRVRRRAPSETPTSTSKSTSTSPATWSSRCWPTPRGT